MKFFINDPQKVVDEGIEGLLTDPKLTKLDNFPEIRVVLRKNIDKNKVAIISGGGSGHEPAHAGFVGKGMLTAAVCGDIFASPSVDAVLSAILATTGDKGCLLIIKNYTGDRLNFGLAAEQAREMGYKVETVIVGDDIALGEDTEQRGLAGTLFVHKAAGYLAEEGKSLEEVTSLAKKVAQQMYSIGLSLEEGQKFQNPEESRLDKDEAELGLGIHGEPGVETISMDNAEALMKKATTQLKEYLPSAEAEYALILNNLGSVTPIEMNILLHAFRKSELAAKVKCLVGPSQLMTSLNMNGFSLSLLQLDEEINKALTADVEPAAWIIREFGDVSSVSSPELPETLPFEATTNEKVEKSLKTITEELISLKKELNEIDEKVGDGDAGSTFAAGAKKIKELIPQLPLDNSAELFISIGRILARETGGSSGVLLSLMFTRAGNAYKENEHLGKALNEGLQKMKEFGGAEEGQRTMIDALQPAFKVLAEDGNLKTAAEKAREGAEKTKKITNTDFGRSSYLSEKSLKDIPDPGAEAVARVFEKLIG
ncbi:MULTISPECIES: dihydroxyacetone kinase subunit DhaK [Mesonia]|uniref:Dihydroxyacetone kinase n=1 Tax=Mesonia oceanica TaxID=2687242 RepID=A0AC61Y780_9FLAO|nr:MULTISPECIES: dihydroxyacetone kinase subunit DhaK [Mesonia]MAN28835.1 dihydroxyacetone kinase [Mesonia sp.]MAQ40418.1 dihydroxyacetone kinase [Mesonia sp.]MBJ98039.1 dihydroxyacetone kinase [Flavobacteriaceae bacterium]VVV00255.1 Dihydroxyacetone kinase [Mesonia oceanica]|tara:strand:- start:6134 stop:7756 length:1623 start_codon:yes stop_codon:yes gene_type:complete